MPIPATQQRVVEAIFGGTVAAAGSNTRTAQFVFHYSRPASAVAINKANFEAAFETQLRVPITAALNVRYTHTYNSIRIIDDAMDAPTVVTQSRPGLIAGDSMPTDQAAFLLMKTGLRGKSFRGSKHLFPMSESDSTLASEDLFNVGCLARLATIATAMLGAFTDAGGDVWTPCIVSKLLSQLKTNPTNVVYYPVIAVTVNKRIGSMIHRKVKSVY